MEICLVKMYKIKKDILTYLDKYDIQLNMKMTKQSHFYIFSFVKTF